MDVPKLSVVIPYKQRLHNVGLAFAALADQTMDRSQFDVVVGAMEYCPAYVDLCRRFGDRLDIVSVMTGDDWNLSRARNLAIRHASGQVLVIVDADMALPPRFLQNLYDRHFAHGQNVCVVGKMIGYDDVQDSDVESVDDLPYGHYRRVLAGLEASEEGRKDARWSPEYASAFARFPWVYARGGLMAIPSATVRRHGLLYDEGFAGWGPEDQEWALRVTRTGTPIVLGQDVYGLHLPHRRSIADNGAEADSNNRYYLGKWPRRELELALAFGWLETDRIYPDVERELARAVPGPGHEIAVVRGTQGGRSLLAVGAAVDARSWTPVAEVGTMFDAHTPLEVLPLAGFALPYADGSVDECRVLPPVLELSARYREAVLRTAERVSRKFVAPAEPRRDDRP